LTCAQEIPDFEGRGIAQAVILRLPTAAARDRVQVRSCGISGGQSGTGAGFLQVLRFLLPILIPPTAAHSSSSSIIRGWYNRPNSGRRTKWTQSNPPQETKKNYPILISIGILTIPENLSWFSSVPFHTSAVVFQLCVSHIRANLLD
jgi:hypothetical protein